MTTGKPKGKYKRYYRIVDGSKQIKDVVIGTEHNLDETWIKGSGPFSEQTRQKMAEIRTGKKHSEATKGKMSLASKGKPKSPEHRANISKAKRTIK